MFKCRVRRHSRPSLALAGSCYHCAAPLSALTTSALTSVWSDVRVATSGVFSTTVFVACLSPTLHVHRVGSGSAVSPPQAAQRWVFFYIHSFSRCLLTGAFGPFTVKGIIDKNLLPFCWSFSGCSSSLFLSPSLALSPGNTLYRTLYSIRFDFPFNFCVSLVHLFCSYCEVPI